MVDCNLEHKNNMASCLWLHIDYYFDKDSDCILNLRRIGFQKTEGNINL